MSENQRKKLSETEAAEEVEAYAGRVSEETVEEIVDNQDKMKGFFEKVAVLKKYFGDACDIFSLLSDRLKGRYTTTPWRVVAALAGALLYVLSPLDAIPDFLPAIGYVDDAAVFAFALKFASGDLEKYREWKKNHRTEEEA